MESKRNKETIILFRKGWELLDPKEKRHALIVLTAVILSALTSALMVGSIMPFLTALSNPSEIHEQPLFITLYELGGFQTDFGFIVALGVGSLTIIVVANLIQILRLYLVVNFATMRMHTLSKRLLSVYLRQPYTFYLNRKLGRAQHPDTCRNSSGSSNLL